MAADKMSVNSQPLDSFLPAVWGEALLASLTKSSVLADHLANVPRSQPTRLERLARWWDARRPRVHAGPCNHDDCDTW